MIKNHLSRLLGERRLNQTDLKRRTGIRANTICDLYNELAAGITFENLERICVALDCDISDLLELRPGDKKHGKETNKS